MTHYPESYWREGTVIIEKCRDEAIAQAKSPEWYSHCPIDMSPDQCRGYLGGKIDAWQHALEMMGCPSELDA